MMTSYPSSTEIELASSFFPLLRQTHSFIPGFQSAFQSVGFRHNKYTPLIKNLGTVYAILIPLGFIYYYIYKNIDFNFTNQFSLNLILISTVLINLLVAEFFLVSRFVFIAILMFYYSSVETKLIASEHKNKY